MEREPHDPAQETAPKLSKKFPPELRVFMSSLDFVQHVELYIFYILFCGFSGTLLAFLTLSVYGEGLKYHCRKYTQMYKVLE
jgi:hypothetical protein